MRVREQVSAVGSLMHYSESHGGLLQKFNDEFFLAFFDKYTIEELEERIGRVRLNKNSFVRHLVTFIPHRPDQTLFLVMSLLTVFAKLAQQSKEGELTVKDFTQYLCQIIANRDSCNPVNNKEMPLERRHPDCKKVRDIDLHPPSIQPHPNKDIPKISRSAKKKEKKVDAYKPLHTFCFSQQRREVITLGRLASHITIFSHELVELRTITPACFRLFDKSMAILSLAFSERQQRVGCIIAHTGMAFWDYEDDFQTQKLIRRVIGDRIYYLPLLDEWITTTSNRLFSWDLRLEQVKFSFGEENAININDLKQITHLRCLAVSYTLNDEHKWVYVYRNDGMKQASRLRLGHVGAQKLYYNRPTQALLLLGKNELPVYTIDALSLDLTLLKNLVGHETVITAVADLQGGLIVSGDDRGSLRVWDLNTLRCQQVIKVANSINQLESIGHNLLFSDSRLNILRIEQLTTQPPIDELHGIRHFYRLQPPTYEMFIFTPLACRIYDLTAGRLQRIVQLCGPQQQIVAVERLESDFLVAASKGSLICFSSQFVEKWRLAPHQYHSEEILHLRSDPKNKFFATVGKEGNIFVWNEKTFLEEGPRKTIQSLEKSHHFEVALFEISQRYSLMVTGQRANNVKLWDYESCKLCHIVELQSAASAIKISENQPLLSIGCLNERIYLYKLSRKQNVFEVKVIALLDLSLLRLADPPETQLSVEFKNLYCQSLVLSHRIGRHQLIAAYGKGSVAVYDTTLLVHHCFRQNSYYKLAVNIQRPIRQTLEKQLHKNQSSRTAPAEDTPTETMMTCNLAWRRRLHKDSITDISTFQDKYISTISLDGYFKLVSIEDGQPVCSLSIRHPLPTLWKLSPFQCDELARKVHEALTVISQIVNDKQQKFTRDELEALQVQNFMKMICKDAGKRSPSLKYRKSIRVMRDELAPDDLRRTGNSQSDQTLKYLQAFKRVSLIKEAKPQQEIPDVEAQKKYASSLEDKETLVKFFSPNYFPALCNKKEDCSAESQRFEQLFAKSTQISIAHSPEKTKEGSAKDKLLDLQIDLKQRKKLKVLSKSGLKRSLSQSIKGLVQESACVLNEKADDLSRKLTMELQKNEPMRSISAFMKQLNDKMPKESQVKKHFRRISQLKQNR